MSKDGKLHRFGRNLVDLIGPGDAQSARPVSALGGHDAPDFEDRLKTLLERSGQKSLLCGRIDLTGLQKIKDRFGSGWERITNRADRAARDTIERHLAAGDIYAGLQRTTYVIVFARLSETQATAKCTGIADDIAAALLGEQGGDLLVVKASVTRVDAGFNLADVRPAEPTLASHAAEGQLEFAQAESDGADAKSPQTAPAAGTADVLGNLRFAYRPIWDHARSVVSTYLCVPQLLSSDGGTVVGDGAVATEGYAEERARLDEVVRQRAVALLDEFARERRPALVCIKVHFETLGSVLRRRRYVEGLERDLREAARKLLLIEIEAVPQGVPAARLVELLAPLRPHCRGIMLCLPLETADFTNVKGCDIAAVGCDIAAHTGSEALLMQQMNRFARAAAETTGLLVYVHGVKSMSVVAAALGAGFGCIDGDVVAKPVEHPRGLIDLSLADIYQIVVSG